MVGEFYFGGVGLVCGYFNWLDLIIECFILYFFKDGEWLYWMGDLVRYMNDCNLEYIGRIDN